MKNYLVFGFFLLIIGSIKAQRERIKNLPTVDEHRIHYGFYLGLNRNDFKINYKLSTVSNPNVIVSPNIGFNTGLIADLRLTKNLNLRFEPGLVSNSKTLTFAHISGGERVREINSTYLHLPLLLKFSTDRLNNIRPYVIGGVSYDYNFSSNENTGEDNLSGKFRTKTTNFMYEVGIGIDIYLQYFKLSPSIRGIFAINNEIKYDNSATSPWTSPINYLGTRGIFLNFSFE